MLAVINVSPALSPIQAYRVGVLNFFARGRARWAVLQVVSSEFLEVKTQNEHDEQGDVHA